MRQPSVLLTLLIGIGMTVIACGRSPGNSGSSGPGDQPLDSDAANAQGSGSADVPTITARTYTGGSARIKASGFFQIDSAVDLNKPASLSDGGFTWLQYGVSGAQTLNVLITFGEGDSGVNIGVGSYTATGTSTECSKKVDVTPTAVSGHFTCKAVTGYNKDNAGMGEVNFEVDFTANS